MAGDSSAAATAQPAGATAAAAAQPANSAAVPATATTASSANVSPALSPTLVDLLVKKGILTTSEANSLRTVSSGAGLEQLLLLLKAKGVVDEADFAELKVAAASDHIMMDAVAGEENATLTTQAVQEKKPETPAGPTVIPAIAPVRVLAVGPPVKEGLKPALKIGGVSVTPYGFIKATTAYDSSDPRGDDFIVPGFLNADTGPNPNPEFHVKARASRFGAKFEWPDVSKNLTLTGQVEGDFEGNFSRADNRNVSSIRSNAFQLRLAFARLDWAASDKTDIFFEGGQDWSIFGSSLLPNLLETTFYGAYFGNVYERSPQMRLGIVEKLGGSRNWKFSPEFAIMMPSEGDLPADSVTCTVTALNTPTSCTFVNGLGNQLGYGERQGADAARPEYEARAVLQFQLDKAPGVAPAEIVWSGFDSARQATVLGSAVPTIYKEAFPTGVDVNSSGYGNQFGFSLPTRWFTLTASAYAGADLRFFFGGQLLSNYTQAGGLTDLEKATSVDGASTVVFGTNAAGAATVAPELPVRGYGGFAQIGLPLSRWFNADPKGRNAGWQLFLHYGLDEARISDFIKAKDIGASGAGPYRSTLKALTVYYKLNPFVTFAFEEGRYQSYSLPNDEGKYTTKVSGVGTSSWGDWRSEFGPVFTF